MNTIFPISVNYKAAIKDNKNINTENKKENLEKKKEIKNAKIDNTQKYLLCGTLAFIGIAGGAALAVKHFHKKVEKLYNEKLILSNLPENIKFEAAKTLEEAKKFTKEILRIKEVDDNFTLEALNYANRSITNVCNVNKGKLYMPSALRCRDLGDETLASVEPNIFSEQFAELSINKKFFDEKYLDEYILSKLVSHNGKKLFEKCQDNEKYMCVGLVKEMVPVFDKEVSPLLDKFYENPKNLSFDEKLILSSTIQKLFDKVNFKVSQNYMYSECKRIAAEHGIELPLHEWNNLKTIDEREAFLDRMYKTIREKGVLTRFHCHIGAPETTIYHEMGHLQDFGKNLKEIDLKQLKTGNEYLFADRWGGMTYQQCLNVFNKDKEEFKKSFPNLYEFITNESTQDTAGKISSYAQSGIGEFVAEAYAVMIHSKISGKSVPEDVIQLYRKYNGPVILN